MSVHMIETRVGRLRVEVIGDRGRTAVLWHSLFVDERSWNGTLSRLADRRRLVVVTGLGHGASTDPGRVGQYLRPDALRRPCRCWTSSPSASRWTGWATPGEGMSDSSSPRIGRIGAEAWLAFRHAGRRPQRGRQETGPGSCWACIGCSAHRRRSWTRRPRCCCRRARSSATRMPSPSYTTASVGPIGGCCATNRLYLHAPPRPLGPPGTRQQAPAPHRHRCRPPRIHSRAGAEAVGMLARGRLWSSRHCVPRAARGAGGIRGSRPRTLGRRASGSDAVKWFYEVMYRHFTAPWEIGPRQELVELVEKGILTPCRAIDLGCGTGANAILASSIDTLFATVLVESP